MPELRLIAYLPLLYELRRAAELRLLRVAGSLLSVVPFALAVDCGYRILTVPFPAGVASTTERLSIVALARLT
jgi:hypothetical protein